MIKYIIYYIEELKNENVEKRFYNYFKYYENDKKTIQNINKEINRQKKNYRENKKINSNYLDIIKIFNNKSYNINIYFEYDENKVNEIYNKKIKNYPYKLSNKPKLKREIYDNSYSEKDIQKDYLRRLKNYEYGKNLIIEKRKNLKNNLINLHSFNKFIEGDLQKIKIYFNNFIDKNKNLNNKKYKIKNNPNEIIKCDCGMTYTRTNKSHHFKNHHNNTCIIIDI